MPMPCLLCRAPGNGRPLFSITDRLSMTVRRYDVLRCPSCGSLQVSPLPSDTEITGLYPAGYNFKIEPGDSGVSCAIKTLEWQVFYRPILRRTYRMISRIVGRGTFSILDVGCGAGQRLQVFTDAGCDAEGNETSASCVAYIKGRGGIPVHEGRIETLDLRRRYDVVTMFALLEHLADPVPVIRAVKKLLNPGGKLVIQVPVVDSLQFKLLGRRAAMINDMPRHIFIPSAAGLRGFMERQGFTLRARFPVSLFERAALFALGLMPFSATPLAYRRSAVVQAGYRALGWGLTVFPGSVVALLDSIAGVGAETIFIFEIQSEAHHNDENN